ncbi:MAG TPA: sigma-70 family RNA polymerase sigma factor [Paludibacteraceae bacterium]|jgi:RNA polymerase sigma-70 factor (ECF subfamily)|nr:sigma-70 family RNA polymerase sigma factor [Paludibacteraceae bacterium]
MDASMFNSLFTALSGKLYRLAKSMLRHTEEAEDALQEVQLKLWEKHDELDTVENPEGFAMRTMRNLCLDKIRKVHDTSELNEELISKNKNPYEQTELNDLTDRIKGLIDRLPEMQRSIMRMRDVEEMEISEIAYIMNLTENAVTVNLSRARTKVKTQILNELQATNNTIWNE